MSDGVQRSAAGVPNAAGMEHLRAVRVWLAVFMAGLVVSGVTAFPLVHEVRWLDALAHSGAVRPAAERAHLLPWIERVDAALGATNARYPFLQYGTDWLAFAHLAIAVAFIGPWRDPVRNAWVITFGLMACVGVVPLALLAGAARGIPIGWRLVDCSFGVVGCVPLLMAGGMCGCWRGRRASDPGLKGSAARMIALRRSTRGQGKGWRGSGPIRFGTVTARLNKVRKSARETKAVLFPKWSKTVLSGELGIES
jgi:hypothetical protein